MKWEPTNESEKALGVLMDMAKADKERLWLVAESALDFAISCGYRPPEMQAGSTDLDWLFAEADRVQTEFEKLRAIGQASMDCSECGGSGSVSAGSLGGCCPTCDGSGVVDAPFAEELGLPDMAAFRQTLKATEKTMLLGGKVDLDVLKLQLIAYKTTGKEMAQKALAAPAEEKRQLRGAPKAGRRRHLAAPLEHPTGIVNSTGNGEYDEDSDDED